MPTMTQEELDYLRQMQAGGLTSNSAFTNGGQTYQPLYAYTGEGADSIGTPQMTGLLRYADGAQHSPGQNYDQFSPTGEFQQTGQFQEHKDIGPLALAIMAGMYFGLPMLGAGTGAAGAAGAAGFSDLAAMSGIGEAGFGAGAAGAGAAGAGAAGAGALSGAGGGGSYLGAGLGAESAALPVGGAASGVGGATGGLNSAANFIGGGAMSSVPSWLGPAASLLGALSGSQGTQQSQSATREIPEWLKQFYTNSQGTGLLNNAQSLMNAGMTPERLAQWDQMRNIGMGLLNTQPSRYFGTQDTPQSRYFGSR